MGRYPFLTMLSHYIEEYSTIWNEKTQYRKRQSLSYIHNEIIQPLKAEGIITTTNPRRYTKADVLAIIANMNNRGWKPLYLRLMVTYLKLFVGYCGNAVFSQLNAKGMLPKQIESEIKTLSEEELDALNFHAKSFTGWTGEVKRFIISFYPATGLRASELRRARIQDIDAKNWTIRVIHPKGEGKYTTGRTAPILPSAREATNHFLQSRAEYLASQGIDESEPLIPLIRNGIAKYYGDYSFRRMASEIREATGIDFTIKDFRSTFAQRTIDLDPTLLPSVSRAMGHSSTVTTEKFYGRIQNGPAIRNIQEAYERAERLFKPVKTIQSALIEREKQLTGYA